MKDDPASWHHEWNTADMFEPTRSEMNEAVSTGGPVPGVERRLRLLIIHDQQVFCEALAVAIALQHRTMAVLGCYPTVRSLLARDHHRRQSADVILLGTPRALEALRQLKPQLDARHPGATVVVLGEPRPLQRDWRNTGNGVIASPTHRQQHSLGQLLRRLEMIRPRLLRSAPAAGDQPHNRIPAERSTERSGDLTPRERDILVLRGQGLSNKEIAVALQIGVQTVKNHARTVTLKLQLRRPHHVQPNTPVKPIL